MTKLKLYDGGWLPLPKALRQQLALGTEAMIESELVDCIIVLRPAGKGRGAAQAEPDAAEPPGQRCIRRSFATGHAGQAQAGSTAQGTSSRAA